TLVMGVARGSAQSSQGFPAVSPPIPPPSTTPAQTPTAAPPVVTSTPVAAAGPSGDEAGGQARSEVPRRVPARRATLHRASSEIPRAPSTPAKELPGTREEGSSATLARITTRRSTLGDLRAADRARVIGEEVTSRGADPRVESHPPGEAVEKAPEKATEKA